jgi:hypothetical protein
MLECNVTNRYYSFSVQLQGHVYNNHISIHLYYYHNELVCIYHFQFITFN